MSRSLGRYLGRGHDFDLAEIESSVEGEQVEQDRRQLLCGHGNRLLSIGLPLRKPHAHNPAVQAIAVGDERIAVCLGVGGWKGQLRRQWEPETCCAILARLKARLFVNRINPYREVRAWWTDESVMGFALDSYVG